jgi:hypothetical protein
MALFEKDCICRILVIVAAMLWTIDIIAKQYSAFLFVRYGMEGHTIRFKVKSMDDCNEMLMRTKSTHSSEVAFVWCGSKYDYDKIKTAKTLHFLGRETLGDMENNGKPNRQRRIARRQSRKDSSTIKN